MKNQVFILTALVGVAMGQGLIAQNQFAIKADLTEALKKNLLAGVEWRFSKKGGVELQLGFRKHNDLPAGVFRGEWGVGYAERRSYSVKASSNIHFNDSGWQYLGPGRPLPVISAQIFPLSTLVGRAGYVRSYQPKPNGLRFLLIPGVSLARHRYFEVSKDVFAQEKDYQSWQVGSLPNEEQFVEQTNYVTQTRTIQERKQWAVGFTNAFGLAWQAKFGLFLEARATIGVNYGDAPYTVPKPPDLLDSFYGQGALLVGWAF